jgi:hypothetical protein
MAKRLAGGSAARLGLARERRPNTAGVGARAGLGQPWSPARCHGLAPTDRRLPGPGVFAAPPRAPAKRLTCPDLCTNRYESRTEVFDLPGPLLWCSAEGKKPGVWGVCPRGLGVLVE